MKAKTIYFLFGKRKRREALILLLMMLIGAMLEVFSIGIVVPVVTILLDPSSLENYPAVKSLLGDQILSANQEDIFNIGILFLICAYTIKTLYLVYLSWKQTKFIYNSQASISKKLFSIYLKQSYSFHMQRNSAQLIRNVVNETTQFSNGSINTGLTLVTEILVVIGIVILLLIIEPKGALIIGLSLISVGLVFYFATKGFVFRLGEKRQVHEGCRIQHVQQGLSGMKDIKLLNREDFFISRYNFNNSNFADAAQKQTFLLQMPRLAIELIAVLTLGILVLIMTSNEGVGDFDILPVLAMFAAAAFRLMPSLNRILGNWQTFQYNQPVVDILYRELKMGVDSLKKTSKARDNFKDSIKMSDVSYYYNNNQHPSINHISLEIRKNSSIGFIGSSGAGKSTLLDLILGLIQPTSGEVLSDNKSIQKNLESWQKKIGYVPQSIYMTDDTLRANIAFGIDDHLIDDNMINKAVKLAQLDEYIDTLEFGLDTMVGESAVRLSGGQKQRIGIARALYHDPDILVLDEATSALDHDTEAEVMRSINFLCGKKTLLIIAHRLSTVSNCDYLYKLEKGRIVASGTPSDLIDV